MHRIEISPDVVERSRRQRGRAHVFETIAPSRTAHVVVDLQVGFMAPGAPVEVPAAREVVAPVNRISAALRAAGGLVVYLRYAFDPAKPMDWSSWYGTILEPGYSATLSRAFTPGSPDFALWPDLEVTPADLIVDKTRFSAFVPGTCDLHELLQARGIETVIVTGTLTNCCCESTARDAAQRNYNVIFVSDGNAALSDAEHNATLTNMTAFFGDVMSSDELIPVIAAGRVPGTAAA
ncbi:cysteine hydrolase family protein [Arenibaculum pallidiluteum]|uniref:cysteine hydrolase family protein n=1 Tax=Arenibaculum pallidiluteum TaxID=2812559 RepID=UPI001A96C74D|nr:isochorismatase family cysteine hydrolase [Arenibaculum pallidiluteum]